MARLFSWRPAVTYRGRKFKGLRGWAGKPTHPPLTDIPVACYFLAGVFDLLSYLLAPGGTASDLYRAGTFVIVAGAIVSAPTLLTGFWDWLKSTPRHTQAWRTANAHMAIMITVTVVVLIDITTRLSGSASSAELPVVILSLLALALVAFGALYGGSLVYDYAFNVEQTFGHAYERSEEDVLPGH